MGTTTSGNTPRHVRDTIDRMSTEQLADLTANLGIPTRDAPGSDLYDWFRQRIYDWLYDKDWVEPTEEEAIAADLRAATARRQELEAELRRAQDYERSLRSHDA